MKVTVDTRHDSLEEALATVHAAFGSATKQLVPRVVATEPASPQAMRHVAKRSGSRKQAASRTGTKRSPAKKAAKSALATNAPARNGAKSTISMTSTSNIAPPGQADAIRAWARTQGMEVKQAGRLPAAVIQAYHELPDH
jgi:hypothetical protein